MSDTKPPKGPTLLDWVLKRHPETPKTRAKQWILAGRVSVNGEIIRKPHHQLADDPGAGLSLGERNSTTLDCGRDGWAIHPRVTLLYLDSSIAIVNKGPGLISVPASEEDLSALSILADFLVGKLRPRDRNVAGKTLPPVYRKIQPLPVHRLDQYTSGIFSMATNPTARHHLIEQLRARTMKREYVAFVQARATEPKGTWRNWLQLSRDEMRQQVVQEEQPTGPDSEAQEAVTHYEVVAEYPLEGGKAFASKLRLRLETGLKHQIRVQAAQAGMPLIGDRTYNPEYRDRDRKNPPRIDFSRQALHAETLSLEHPEQAGKAMSWTAALPKDLAQLEAVLRRG